MDADAIPLYTGPRTADSAAQPFFTADAAARSLNRARLVELPGVAGVEELLGRSASELLSAAAVTALVRAAAGRLALDPDDPALLRAFDAAFDAPRTRPAALAVAETVGRRLAALLLLLWRGDAANRAARPEWAEAHWAFWRAVERVVVGGGLLDRAAGRSSRARRGGVPGPRPAAPSPSSARPMATPSPSLAWPADAPADAERMLLFDFGHTAVKCGLATYQDGALVGVERRPSLPPPCEDGWPEHAGAAWARQRWGRMAAAIAAAWAAEVAPGRGERVAVGLCVASHLQDGHPISRDRGCYTSLGELAPHLATFLRDDLRARLGPFRALAVLHDGLAAASTRAGEPRTVVLTLGTAIGAGYPLGEAGLRPVKLGL